MQSHLTPILSSRLLPINLIVVFSRVGTASPRLACRGAQTGHRCTPSLELPPPISPLASHAFLARLAIAHLILWVVIIS